jgi:hypothetical protein
MSHRKVWAAVALCPRCSAAHTDNLRKDRGRIEVMTLSQYERHYYTIIALRCLAVALLLALGLL